MKSIVFSFIFFCFLLLPASAETVTVVTEDNFQPYNYVKNGKIEGLATHAVKSILKESGLKYTLRAYPWPRAYQMALAKKNVLIYSIARNEKREHLFKWLGPIVPPAKSGLFKLKNRTDILINDLQEAKKYTIGCLAANCSFQFLLQHGFQDKEQLQAVSELKINIEKLFAKRVDLITGTTFHMNQRIKNFGKNPDDVQIAFVFNKIELYMAFGPKTSDQIYSRIHQAFIRCKNAGELDSIDIPPRD